MSLKTLTVIFLLAPALSVFSQEKMVNVNGINYHVLTRSLEQRKPRQPVLVFENGMGMGLEIGIPYRTRLPVMLLFFSMTGKVWSNQIRFSSCPLLRR